MGRLPPFAGLRAFEAAARYESFNRAAEELHVTPSAVSHQIKALEDYLGVALFRRLTRRVELTAQGRAYLPPVRDALDQIRIASEQISRRQDSGPLTISSAPAFAVGWLMPRLAEFQLAHPEVEVRLNAAVEVVDLRRSDIDIGIRTGRGEWPGLRAHRLMGEQVVPVCSPALRTGPEPLARPEDLRRAILIHELPRLGEWRTWLRAAGLDDVDPERGPKMQTSPMVVEAAAAGLGVALVSRPSVENHLRDGRLVIPFEGAPASELGYYLVYLEDRGDSPKIATFRDWLLSVVSDSAA